MLTPGAKRQRTAQLMRDLHTERNALSEMLDREATDHAEAIRERDEARAALAAAERKLEHAMAVAQSAEREREQYRAALEHYADDCRWRPRQSEFSNDQYLGGGESEWDRSRHGWEVARAALAGREREEGT